MASLLLCPYSCEHLLYLYSPRCLSLVFCCRIHPSTYDCGLLCVCPCAKVYDKQQKPTCDSSSYYHSILVWRLLLGAGHCFSLHNPISNVYSHCPSAILVNITFGDRIPYFPGPTEFNHILLLLFPLLWSHICDNLCFFAGDNLYFRGKCQVRRAFLKQTVLPH